MKKQFEVILQRNEMKGKITKCNVYQILTISNTSVSLTLCLTIYEGQHFSPMLFEKLRSLYVVFGGIDSSLMTGEKIFVKIFSN